MVASRSLTSADSGICCPDPATQPDLEGGPGRCDDTEPGPWSTPYPEGARPMNTPPQPPNPRMTWVDQQNRYWRVERVGPRWQLSLYRAAVEAWQRIGSW